MSSNDGKTEKITGRRDEANNKNIPRRKGGFTTESNTVGVQRHVQNDPGTSDRRDRREHRELPSSNIGKILKRLENLEKRFFNYARSHQERLDLRKKESEIAVEEFAIEAASLREELIKLTQNQEQESEDV